MSEHSHFAHEVGAESQLDRARLDLLHCARRAFALERTQQHQQDIARIAVVEEREHRGIRRVAPVPIRLAIDHHGVMNRRQTRRGEQHVDRELAFAKHAQLSGVRLRGADEQLERTARAQPLEVDLPLELIAQADSGQTG